MGIVLVLGVVVVGWVIYTFNRLIQLRQLGDNAWSDIDVQLKRRHDLIPNVVAVVQGHAGYERGTRAGSPGSRSRPRHARPRGGSAGQRVAARRGGRRGVSRAEGGRELCWT